MTDSSEIGRYGTLRLLKRHEPDTTVAFFPIDDEEVTFGRSKQCSVRLYYDCVSELHCTLQISEERKVCFVSNVNRYSSSPDNRHSCSFRELMVFSWMDAKSIHRLLVPVLRLYH